MPLPILTLAFVCLKPWRPRDRLWTRCRLVLRTQNSISPLFFRLDKRLIVCRKNSRSDHVHMDMCIFGCFYNTPFSGSQKFRSIHTANPDCFSFSLRGTWCLAFSNGVHLSCLMYIIRLVSGNILCFGVTDVCLNVQPGENLKILNYNAIVKMTGKRGIYLSKISI